MSVTLSLDEVVELIDAAQGALPYLAEVRPMGEEGEDHVFDRLMAAIGTLNSSLFAKAAGDWEAEAEKRRGRPFGGQPALPELPSSSFRAPPKTPREAPPTVPT